MGGIALGAGVLILPDMGAWFLMLCGGLLMAVGLWNLLDPKWRRQ
jgi:hypothetical protein